MTPPNQATIPRLSVFSRRYDRRKGYRIDPAFQTRFRTTLLAFSAGTVLSVVAMASSVRFVTADPATFLASPWVPAALFAFAVVAGLVVFQFSDRISHRYCGPIRRFRMELEKIRQGERIDPIRLRRNDEFQELADELNATLQKLGAMNDTRLDA